MFFGFNDICPLQPFMLLLRFLPICINISIYLFFITFLIWMNCKMKCLLVSTLLGICCLLFAIELLSLSWALIYFFFSQRCTCDDFSHVLPSFVYIPNVCNFFQYFAANFFYSQLSYGVLCVRWVYIKRWQTHKFRFHCKLCKKIFLSLSLCVYLKKDDNNKSAVLSRPLSLVETAYREINK